MTPLEELPRGEVHVWIEGDDECGLDGVLRAGDMYEPRRAALLDAGERRRLAAIVAPAARRRFVHARALVRRALSRYDARPPTAWRFRPGPWGKPEIGDSTDARDGALTGQELEARGGRRARRLFFNLSHTAGLIACAVARVPWVGIDAEDCSCAIEPVEVARVAFAPCEVEDLAATPVSRRVRRFYRYWTLKEAYLKATGRGFSTPASRFALLLGSDGSIALSPRSGPAAASWHFFQRQVSPRHILAVAIRDTAAPVSVIIRSASSAL